MERTAIILGYISQNNIKDDSGLLKLDNKPMISYVLDAVKDIAEEVIVVTNSKQQENLYTKTVSPKVQVVINSYQTKQPVTAALSGFEVANGKYSLLLPSNSPFVSKKVVSLLFDLCAGKSAVIPRWPDHQIEAMHAVYSTNQTLKAGKDMLANNEVALEVMVSKMQGVRYLSTLVIEQLDPDFETFFAVNTALDLKKASNMLKIRQR